MRIDPRAFTSTDRRLGRRIGAMVREVRTAFGWSQYELGRRIGASQSMVARLEAGTGDLLNVGLIDRALGILGIDIRFDGNLPNLQARVQQRDSVHARCGAFVGRHLIDRDWTVRHEVEVGGGRFRGWIDLLAYRHADRSLFCPELKSEIHDLGAIQRTLTWYEREAWTAARAEGWLPRRLVSGLIVLCSDDVDRALLLNRDLLAQAFPGRATAIAEWLADPDTPIPPRSLAMVDPRSRRRAWLRPTRLDGRRSPAPFRNYADAAAQLRAPRRARRA
jgi:transcriptional regulator with XRE-family HTH domain